MILLLHGFPSSSRMYEPFLQRLSDKYRLIAPDPSGFGPSSAPDPVQFHYTFEHLADVIKGFVRQLNRRRYVLFIQDYGGPVGMRLAQAMPEPIAGLVMQNAVAHEEGLGPLWETRRAFWRDRAAHESALRANFFSPEATRLRHVGKSPYPEYYDPDLWTDELAFLARPVQYESQTELFYDYQSNVASYPTWQSWLREHTPRTLVV